MLTFANVWKNFGYNAVIYLAAITGIDAALYDVATVDGAGRLDVIDTYTVRNGLEKGMLSYSTSIEIFKSVISLILVSMASMLMKRTTENSLY
jgi:ABC-type polysaccharide transport system permease subunit